MLNKYFILLVLFAISCSGEKYDVSKAINILPDKIDTFTVSPSLKKTPIIFDGINYYEGTLEKQKIAKLSGKISNFEIGNSEVCYIKSNLKLACLNLEKASQKKEIQLISNNSNIKLKNISSLLLTVEGNNAVAISNNGYVIKANIYENKLDWTAKINDITTLKPLIYQNKVFIFTSSGALKVFDLETGEEVSSTEKQEDPIGINFNLTQNLSPTAIPEGGIMLSYYKSDLLFFDISTGVKVFNIPLSNASLDFIKINTTPIIFRSLLFASTSSGIVAISLAGGTKLWNINAEVSSNVSMSGMFLFFFDNKTRNIISISAQNGDIRWKEELNIPKNTKKLWIVGSTPETLLTFNEKGILTAFNINDGEEMKITTKKFFSKNFDYTLINRKIYYTDGSNNLIILK